MRGAPVTKRPRYGFPLPASAAGLASARNGPDGWWQTALPIPARHDPGIVDEDIDRPAGIDKRTGGRGHVREIGEIELDRANAGNGVDRLARRREIAAGDDDLGPGRGEGARRFQPQTRMTTGDDDHFGVKVDARQHFG
jgi:hypothetical protein